jgi:hypothetical protein
MDSQAMRWLRPVERVLYKLGGIDPEEARDGRVEVGPIGLGPDGSLPPPTYLRNDGIPARVNRKATIVQEDRLPADAPLVEKHFGDIPARPTPSRPSFAEPPPVIPVVHPAIWPPVM